MNTAWRIAASRWKPSSHSWLRAPRICGAPRGWRGFAHAAEAKVEEDKESRGGGGGGGDAQPSKQDNLVDYCLQYPAFSVKRIEAWTARGNTLTQGHISEVIEVLYNHQKFLPALQVLEFARTKTDFVFSVADAIREVTIVTRQIGSTAGQKKMNDLPEELKNNEEILGAYLRALTRINAASKALSVIKDFNPTTPTLFSSIMSAYAFLAMHDKMLPLYTKIKEAGIKPTIETYMLLLLKYQKRVGGLEGIEDEARAAMEDVDIQTADSTTRNYMLEMYGYLGERDKVENLWSIIKGTPGKIFRNSYFSAMVAFCYLRDVNRAEELLQECVETMEVIPGRNQYFKMMDVYCKLGMMDKAEKIMAERADDEYKSFYPSNALAEGYLSVKEPDKALKRMEELGSSRPSYEVVMGLLPVFESRRDVIGTKSLVRSYLNHYRGDVYLHNKVLKVFIAAEERPPQGILDKFQIDPNDETRELMKVIRELPEAEETAEDAAAAARFQREERNYDRAVNKKTKKGVVKDETSPKKGKLANKWHFLQSMV